MADLEYLNIGRLVLNDPFLMGKFTSSSLPSATREEYKYTRILVTDLGTAGTVMVSDGTKWVASGPSTIYSSTVPFIMPDSGSFGNNGALTGIATLAWTMAAATTGGCYMYFPAGAIRAADVGPPVITESAAGWYYTVMSSATAGTVYTDTYTTGVPTIPSSPTAWVATGPGAFTATTTAIAGQKFVLPAKALPADGVLDISGIALWSGDTNSKVLEVKIGTDVIYSHTNATAANVTSAFATKLFAAGRTGAQYGTKAITAGTGTSTDAALLLANDTTTALTISVVYTTANVASNIAVGPFKIVLS